MDPDKYTYQIFLSPDDNEYVGICLEFKYLSWLADTPEKNISRYSKYCQRGSRINDRRR